MTVHPRLLFNPVGIERRGPTTPTEAIDSNYSEAAPAIAPHLAHFIPTYIYTHPNPHSFVHHHYTPLLPHAPPYAFPATPSAPGTDNDSCCVMSTTGDIMSQSTEMLTPPAPYPMLIYNPYAFPPHYTFAQGQFAPVYPMTPTPLVVSHQPQQVFVQPIPPAHLAHDRMAYVDPVPVAAYPHVRQMRPRASRPLPSGHPPPESQTQSPQTQQSKRCAETLSAEERSSPSKTARTDGASQNGGYGSSAPESSHGAVSRTFVHEDSNTSTETGAVTPREGEEDPQGKTCVVAQTTEAPAERVGKQSHKRKGALRSKGKRPINAFMAFASHLRTTRPEDNQPFNNKDFLRDLGERWKHVHPAEKEHYKELANRLTRMRDEEEMTSKGATAAQQLPIRLDNCQSYGRIPNSFVWSPDKAPAAPNHRSLSSSS